MRRRRKKSGFLFLRLLRILAAKLSWKNSSRPAKILRPFPRWIGFGCGAALCLLAAQLSGADEPKPAVDQATVIVIAGAAGEAEFGAGFTEQVETCRKVGAQAGAKLVVIGTEAAGEPTDHDAVKAAFAAENNEAAN